LTSQIICIRVQPAAKHVCQLEQLPSCQVTSNIYSPPPTYHYTIKITTLSLIITSATYHSNISKIFLLRTGASEIFCLITLLQADACNLDFLHQPRFLLVWSLGEWKSIQPCKKILFHTDLD